jgi:tripartite-type tricarboxylate transporter receptor subunit TctC
MRRTFAQMFALTLAVAAPFTASAQATYPDKPVTYTIPFPPGGESDIAARFQQAVFRKKYGQELIIVNKAGAGGALAWSQLNSLAGDGTQIMGINLPHVVLQPMEGNVQYKSDDLVPVYWFHYTPDAIVVPIGSPYKTFQDLVAAARAKPGELSFAGSGTNSANHVAHEKWNQVAGVKTLYVPFKGTGDLVSAVLGSHVTAAMTYVNFAIGHKGKVRALAVATRERHPALPDVPTFKELGFDWVEGAYRGIAVPKATPETMRKRISDVFDEINRDPQMRKQMIDGGFEVIDIGYEQVPGFMQERRKAYQEAARRLGLLK